MKLPCQITGYFFSAFLILMQASPYSVHAQDIPTTPPVVEQELENLTENNDDAETEDDAYLQQMQHFINDPINLNTASESDLNELKILTPLQIHYLLSYRSLLGGFINIYELQAIPGWDVLLIRKVKAYVTVANNISLAASLKDRFKTGGNTLLARVTQVLERSKGYLSGGSTGNNFYPGSPQKLLLRYKYQYKNMLQYGITAEKDAGEQFFKGKQKAGFDFYSAHFFAKNIGIIKSLALGDFVVNLGQGLTQWQGLAFKKSSDVLNIKRQADILRPYNSAGEILFHRGAAITLQKKSLEATAFVSYRKIDANFHADTLNNEDFVSSLQTSGYHRTAGEAADKNTQGQFTLGGNLSLTKDNWHLGFNGIHYNFRYPIIKSGELYNKFSLTGTGWHNYSIDYSYTFKNIHFFGEAASDRNFNKAFINGLLVSVATNIDMSFVYRKISRGYQSLYANAFTESTFPNNESGFYTGISITPADAWKIDAYADIYNFPWLKFRINAPSSGKDYLLQLTYKPNRQVEIYTRYRTEKKAINYNPNDFILSPVVIKPRQNWRSQVSYKISPAVTLRSRIELLWYDNKASPNATVGQSNAAENGFLFFTDILYKPLLKPYSANIRLQYFETDGYNSRLYAYENDVLYSFSIPVFYGKGYRYYINLSWDLSRKISFWFRMAQNIFPDNDSIGTGLDRIISNRKTEFKFQTLMNF
ncbi:MAG: helix-hairpin-helix domain-containing protein [Ginsengibacter sp.]